MARKTKTPLEEGRALRKKLIDEASTVLEKSRRVQQLGLPIAMGGKADQMLIPGFDIDQRLDPRRTWKPR